MEVNCITDIELTINLDQIKLMSALNNELKTLLSGSFKDVEDRNHSNNTAQRFSSGFQNIKPVGCQKQTSDDSDLDFAKDSGVDFEMSSMHSTIIVSYYYTFTEYKKKKRTHDTFYVIYFKTNVSLVSGKTGKC